MAGIKADVRVIALLIVSVLITAACGSTIQDQPQSAVGTTGDELGDLSTDGGLPPGAHINDKGQVVSSSGEVLGSAEDFGISTDGSGDSAATGGSGSTTGGSSGIRSGGSGGVAPAAAPGITDTKIYVGVTWSDAGAANEAFAGAALNSDIRDPMNAMIAEVNKHGGIADRKIEPVYFARQAESDQTADQQEQAACAHFTQDNKVFSILGETDITKECGEKAGAVVLSPVSTSLPEDFKRYPHFIEMSGMNLIRVGNVTIEGLYREGYFDEGAKLGVALWDEPNYKDALKRGFLPALKEKGIHLATEPAYISSPQTVDDLAAASADVNNAVLRFQSQGITHVILIDGNTPLCRGACLGTMWLRRSESQNYRPRYGFNQGNQAQAAVEAGLYPPEQLPGSISVEWDDSDKSADEGWKLNKTREHCYDIMRKHNVSMDNGNKQADARTACEFIWFMQTVIDAKIANAVINSDSFISGVNALGWGYSSATSYAVHFSPTQHDGIAAARNRKFVNSCKCYKWTGDPYRV